jgi:uncharacterized RDD family membrane protein YckC
VSSQPLPSFPSSGEELHAPGSAPDYASWGRRAAAFLLDGLLIAVVAGAVASATGHHTPLNVFAFHTVNGQRKVDPIGTKLVFFSALEALLGFAYGTAFLASAWQATPFMRLLSIHVARADDLGRVSLGRAAGRTAIFTGASAVAGRVPIGSLVILVDLLWPLWDPRNQTVHDKLAGTVVLRRGPAIDPPVSIASLGDGGPVGG